VMQTDHDADVALYGHDVDHRQILHGDVATPVASRGLLHELDQYPPKVQTSQAN